ncbi:MAG: imidazole glycerol phosphate synthase subunit HisF, partial [Polyangiaceae bacterium]|nr:imidazole glycerol phosphate synthase subunit HisF [Polyangiaceae bacterium]
VFPGVGSFGSMMQTLEARGFIEALRRYLASGRPFLGICLGLQALFEGSDEAPGVPGLGVLRGRVRRLATQLAVPHIGWNGISIQQPSYLFAGLRGDEKVYFVHSYFVVPDDREVVLTTTDYGERFVSSVQSGAIVATQFHPEKSGQAGLRMLENFLRGAATAPIPERSPQSTRLSKRIIACLDVRANDQGDLVVTKGDQYDVREQGAVRNLGKPVELARRYYQEGADEITFLNITGFRHYPLTDLPLLGVLRETSKDVFVPLTIGGGIRDTTDVEGNTYSALDVASAYFRSGADKVSIGSEAVHIVEQVLGSGRATGQSAIETIARVYGNQAVVISIDPRRVYVRDPTRVPQPTIATELPGPRGERFCWYECTTSGGRQGSNVDATALARVCEQLGAGEILLNCIDRDGTNAGFDLELIRAVKAAVTIPVIASSGAGSVEHFSALFRETNVESALAAGIFHRREVPIEAVKEHLRGLVEIR